MKNVPLIYWAALVLTAGIAIGTAFPWPSAVVMIACLLAIILAIVMLGKRSPSRGAKSLLAVFFLFGLAHSNVQLSDTGPSWILQKGYCPVTVRGQVVSIPEKVAGQWGRFVLNIDEIDGQVVAQAKAEVYCQWPESAVDTGLEVNHKTCTSTGRATGTSADTSTGIEEGSIITVTGKILTAQAPVNPGEPDERLRHRIAGIRLRLEAWDSVPHFQGRGRVGWLRQIAINIRARLKKVTTDTMPLQEAALLDGIMLGSKEIPAAVKEAFTKTGVVHILSVSGLHVSLVAAAIGWLLKKLRVPDILVLMAVTGCIWLYIMICGMQPPALRSGIMTVASLTGSVCGGGVSGSTRGGSGECSAGGIKISGSRRLVLAAIILLLINPLLLWDAGFQLSFFATAGIFIVGPVLLAAFQNAAQKLSRLRRGMAENRSPSSGLPGVGAIACSLGVFLTILPLNALYFNYITPVSLISNIIVVPLASAALYLGLVGTLTGILFLPLGLWLNSGTIVLLKALKFSAQALARVPGGTMVLAAPGFPMIAVYYALLICVTYALHRKTNPRPAEVIWHKNTSRRLLLIALAISAILVVYPALANRKTKVVVVDVGQGCAVLVQFASGANGLIDCGPAKSSGASIVANLLRHYGVRNLDFVMISHGHADHCGALPALMEEFSIRKIIVPSDYKQRPVLKQLANDAALQGISTLGVGSGNVFESGKARIEVLWPAIERGLEVAGDENGGSLTLRISDQGRTLLLPGDLGTKELNALVKGFSLELVQPDLKSDAWVVAHHGSAGSYCPEFYQAVDPELSIVPVGNNAYGHPSGKVLEGLIADGSRILLTSTSGAVTLMFGRDALSYNAWCDRGLFGLWRWRKRSIN